MTEQEPAIDACGICRLHADPALEALLIHKGGPWLLRHHPHPSPLVGWLVLDSRRHVTGPDGFDDEESASYDGVGWAAGCTSTVVEVTVDEAGPPTAVLRYRDDTTLRVPLGA